MSDATRPDPPGEPLAPRLRSELEIEALRRRAHLHPPGIQPPPELPAASPRRALLVAGLLLVLLAAAGAATLAAQVLQRRALARQTEREAVPSVAVVHPQPEPAVEELTLPATLQAWEESPIFARIDGYLLRWHKDIGSPVAKGELLAEIDAPEVDQELSQARAVRGQAQAQAALAKVTAERWQTLFQAGSVSRQDTDQQTSAYLQAQANLAAAGANVRRLEQLEGFKRILAPFAGVITRRNVDPGALINAGTGASPGTAAAGRELFDLARVDPLRVSTSVPQAYAGAVRTGTRVRITLQERPGATFTGTVARTASAIDPATLTLRIEVDLPNPEGRLLPGSFGQVHFAVAAGVDRVTLPGNALLFRAEGPRAAVVGADGRVQLRPLTLGRDYGTALEVLAGVGAADRVVLNPADSLEAGQRVQVQEGK